MDSRVIAELGRPGSATLPTSSWITESEGYVESVYAGVVRPDELEQAVLRAVDLARKSGIFRFYTDLTGLAGGHSVGDLFALIAGLEQQGLPRTLREAIVLSGTSLAAKEVQFYEDACRNRGWNIRIFPDRESALTWLTSA
jgi:hypothetical protein